MTLFEFNQPHWAWMDRFSEWLHPGINEQVERWGRVTRRRFFLGGLIEIETMAELKRIDDEHAIR